ncbi:leucine-rich repeat-containing protein 52-like [Hemicordylus capensis]|uniref:leucine-rich repeat-containing protein 52-like n=1 Tax=Hemicordylus capensis TaxID=884348 RepID=UPI002302E186|nr:leucine-rich repeat-containing protein 52-like [Hemicordylus capensis]
MMVYRMRYRVLPSFRNSTSFWLALLIGMKWAERGLSCPSDCTCDRLEVDCSGKNLLRFPSPIPLTTKKLYIAQNHLTCLSPLQMNLLNDLVYLDCSHNEIKMSLNFSFPGSIKLTYLDLSHNQFFHINDNTFSKLNRLLLLNLSSNAKIQTLGSGTFHNNHLLRYLDISGCGISMIDEEMFLKMHNLRTLGLSNNPWICDCDLMDLCSWVDKKHSSVSFPKSEEMVCNEPRTLRGKTLKAVNVRLHDLCLLHLDTNHFVIVALIGIGPFLLGITTAWLLGMVTVLYCYPMMKIEDESDDEMN